MKEINRYRLALLQYQLSRLLPKSWFKTQKGFCKHFNNYLFSINLSQELPTLWSLKPLNAFEYWFSEGKLKPRIKLLKQAIKLCKRNY